MKLQSMTDFVLGIRNRTTSELCEYMPSVFTAPKWKGYQDEMVKDILAFDAIKFRIIGDYAKFLKQPLELGMFVPCDLEGNVLGYPIYTTNHSCDCYCKECEKETKRCSDEQEKYREAKERVLFEGYSISHNAIIGIWCALTLYSTIECLVVDFEGDITLTDTAKKQIGL